MAQGFYQPPAEESIYTHASLQTPHLLNWGLTYDRSINDYWEEDGVYVSLVCQYSSQLPAAVQDKITELAQINPAQLEAVKAMHTAEQSVGSFDVAVWPQCCGDYVSVTQVSLYFDAERQTDKHQCFVYRADTGEAVALADLFQPGFDYQSVIKTALEQVLPKEALQELTLEHLQWVVGEQGLELRAALGEHSQYIMVPYSDFGPENMVIFH